jgi:D-glycero-alpha-D-manno-heptose-7-phosphate kinase
MTAGETCLAAQAAAPVRLDFAGGWTDVPPFSSEEGGVVVNAAIALHAHARVEPRERGVRIEAEDLGETLEAADVAALASDGRLDLVKAALRVAPPPGGCVLRTRSDAPPGSGLGSSGAMDVALMAVLAAARGERPHPAEIAERGWRMETQEAGIAGGKQDQWSAALGGFQRLEFRDPEVRVERLALDAELLDELARRTVLCYTGHTRLSGATIARVIDGYVRGDAVIRGAFHAMRECAERMAEALRTGDLARVGALLSANWREQQRLDPGMRTETMARLETAVAAAGVLGGKAAGSGAGGSMFFLARDPVAVAEAARAAGARVLPVAWDHEGVRTC